ncbi:Rab GTPase domain-containing protein, variant 3 [Balamuthia mandrillaris]
MSSLAGVRPEEVPLNGYSNALNLALNAFIEHLPHSSRRNRTRLIWVLQTQPAAHDFNFLDGGKEEGSPLYDACQVVDSILNVVNANAAEYKIQGIEHCELVLIKLKQENEDLQSSSIQLKKISSQLSVALHCVHPSTLASAFVDLAVHHFNLASVRVTGIPMKESSSEASRAIYDVILLHPHTPGAAASARSDHDNKQILRSTSRELPSLFLGSEDSRRRTELVLQWKTTPLSLNADTLACSNMVRVSPLDLRSSPSVCLMKHVCSGRTVTLITPDQTTLQEGRQVKPIKASSPIPATHVITQYQGDVVLRRLHAPLPFSELPLQSYATPVPNLRLKEMTAIIEATTIPLLTLSESMRSGTAKLKTVKTRHEGQIEARPNTKRQGHMIVIDNKEIGVHNIPVPAHLERYTRHFPYKNEDTVLFSPDQGVDLKKLLKPLKKTFLRAEPLDEESLDKVIDIVSRIYQFAHQNDSRLFPHLSNAPTTRREFYRKLWYELLMFGTKLTVNTTHEKIVTAMRDLWPLDRPELLVTPEIPKAIVQQTSRYSFIPYASLSGHFNSYKHANQVLKEKEKEREREREQKEKEKKEREQEQVWKGLNKFQQAEELKERGVEDLSSFIAGQKKRSQMDTKIHSQTSNKRGRSLHYKPEHKQSSVFARFYAKPVQRSQD